MNVQQILEAWKQAAETGSFYEEFQRLTTLDEATVKAHFGDWVDLSHEVAEEIAADEGVTIREGGFQAYLGIVLRSHNGMRPLAAYTDFDRQDPNPRADRPWPPAEDCKGCDGRDGAQYQHRFGCNLYGARAGSMTIPVRETTDGKLESVYPLNRGGSGD